MDNSLQGKGIYIFNKSSLDENIIEKLGNGVFQEYIEQHDFFNGLMPNSVATIRITSVVEDNGTVSCRAAYLRLGREKDTHVRSVSAIKIPIDLNNGKLYEKGYLTNYCTVDRHPDTRQIFAKKTIPCFNKCIMTVMDLHRKIPFCRCIGWDVAIDKKDEIKVMEWNGEHNDIKFSEATQGPCFIDLGWEKIWKF